MSYLRKLWNNISQDWKNIFIHQFSISLPRISHWNTFFINSKFLDSIYQTTSLNLENQNLKELSGLVLTPNLKSLNLNKNQLTTLDGIQNAPNLSELFVSKNFLKNIYSIYELKKLEILDISHNNIEYIFALFQVPIKELYCNHNKIKTLEGLEYIRTLEIVNASFNKLSEIDFSYWENSPKEIWVSNNRIRKVMGLSTNFLKTLQILDLSFNPIKKEDLPTHFQNELILEGNFEPEGNIEH